MKWTEDAQKLLSRVPFFVRGKVKERVEEEAVRCGARVVTPMHVDECKNRFLNRMEEEVRGFRVETCFGTSGCPNRAVVSDGLANKIEKRLSDRNLKAFLRDRVKGPLKLHHEFRVSISECPNACSRPQIADFGLVGACMPAVGPEPCSSCGACVEVCQERAVLLQDGSPRVDPLKCLGCGQCVKACPSGTLIVRSTGHRVLLGGKLGRHPRLAEETPDIHEQEGVLEILASCLEFYERNCTKGERFGEILERLGVEGARLVKRAEHD
jgi:anaerobic sulfite reductase subunit C